jgi:very-short-patch-repair endonuclease
MSEGEDLVAAWLNVAGIPYVAQWRFHPTRRWRFDFALGTEETIPQLKLALEVEGGQWIGGHKRGSAADTDCEKFNAATMLGWKVLRFTTAQVKDGRAWKVIHQLWHSS